MTIAERVHDAVKNGILAGDFAAGTFLREEAVAGQLAVSRTPVREAFRRLVSEGWLEAAPNRGARVVEWTESDVDEVFELRAALEPLMARRAAQRICAARLRSLETLAGDMERLAVEDSATARDQITGLNQQFHAHIAEAAESPRIHRILQGVVQVPVARRSFHHYTSEELARSMAHHRELIGAMTAMDGQWAAAVMKTHILAARWAHLRGATGRNADARSVEGRKDESA